MATTSVATATEIVKDGEFGAKSGKKDGQLIDADDQRKIRPHTHHHEDKKTFQGLLDSIRRSRGVLAVMLMDRNGNIAKTTFSRTASSMYCGISAHILNNVIPLIESLDTKVKFRLLRSNAGVQELLIQPVVNELVFVVVQNCSDRPSIATSCRPDEKKHTKRKHSQDATHPSIQIQAPTDAVKDKSH